MFASHRLVLSLAALLGVAGCATPRFETVLRREMPSGSTAQACLASCERGLEDCKLACAEKYRTCLKQVEPEAEEYYRQSLDRYARVLEQYRRELATHEFQLWSSFSPGRGAYWYDPLPFHHPMPPLMPRAPKWDETMNRFREERCGGDCGCQPPYDACFQACGGSISTERRCVRGCPE